MRASEGWWCSASVSSCALSLFIFTQRRKICKTSWYYSLLSSSLLLLRPLSFCRFLSSTSSLTFLCVLFSLYRTFFLQRVLIPLHTNFSTSTIAIFSIARSSQCHIAWIIRHSFLSFPCISVHSILPKWNILFNNIELAMIIIIANY